MRSLNIGGRYPSQKTRITYLNLRKSLNYCSTKVSDIAMITWHTLSSPETCFYTSLSLQDMGQTKPNTFHHFRDVGSWMSGMNYQNWKMNFELWPWFFLWGKIFAFPMFTQSFKTIEDKVAVIQPIESRKKSQNHAFSFSQLSCDLVLQFDFYGAHSKDNCEPKKS